MMKDETKYYEFICILTNKMNKKELLIRIKTNINILKENIWTYENEVLDELIEDFIQFLSIISKKDE